MMLRDAQPVYWRLYTEALELGLPEHHARAQARDEFNRLIRRAYAAGARSVTIGDGVGLRRKRVWQIVAGVYGQDRRRSPLERWTNPR